MSDDKCTLRLTDGIEFLRRPDADAYETNEMNLYYLMSTEEYTIKGGAQTARNWVSFGDDDSGPQTGDSGPKTGFICEVCKDYNDYATANQPNGTYICYEHRT